MSNESDFREKYEYKIYKPDDMEASSLYMDYVSEQKQPFIALLNFFAVIILSLKSIGTLSEHVKFIARIKSLKSALNNHNSEKQKKLDDIFGITFIGATEKELKILQNELLKYATVTREKKPKASNSSVPTHNAKHVYYCLKANTIQDINSLQHVDYQMDKFPMFEVQYKTIEQDYSDTFGDTAHWKYKCVNPEEVQKKYKNNDFKAGYNLPFMYEYTNGSKLVQLLDYKKTLKKMYPFLNVTSENSKEL